MNSTKTNPIRVLIADDHDIVRQGIKTIISDVSDIIIAGEAESGDEVLKKFVELDVDVVIMDYDMPDRNGLDTLIELKAINPQLPVIILSMFPEDHYGVRFLKAGASGYLGKSNVTQQLVEAIRRVVDGHKYISPSLADKLVSELNKDSERPLHENLTDREFQVFHLIATGKRLKAIAEEL
ncbi:MAG: response regulator transcription factor, partial [Proteobacteria bacterium]|nr:response regulator transcription factor [Pseudomonadota bacterium]